MYEWEKNLLGQPDIPAEAPKNPTSEISANSSLASALDETNAEKPHYFEKISSLSLIDESKLKELQQADWVILYTDNNKYIAMSEELRNLVKIHWWKVYCVEISQDTKKLSDNEKELLKKILDTCRLITDPTMGRILYNYLWNLFMRCLINKNELRSIDRFDYEIYSKDKYTKIFEEITKELEDKFKEKWINTVYILISEKYLNGGIFYLWLDHSCMYQNKDWDIYFDCGIGPLSKKEEITDKIDDFKRFWGAMFPNLKVEFIENANRYDFSRYTSEWIILGSQYEQPLYDYSKGIVDDYIRETTDPSELKSEWAVLIGDEFGYFKSFKGKKISYYENRYRPEWWINYFINLEQKEDEYYGKILAKEIMTKTFGEKTLDKQD